MKFVPILMLTVLFVAGVRARSPKEETSVEPPNVKEKIRAALISKLHIFTQIDIENVCPRPLLAEEITFANKKQDEFIKCGNATIDKFITKLDDSATYNEPEVIGQLIKQYSVPACKVSVDLYSCVSSFGPVLDMCLDDDGKIVKRKLFALLPFMREDICVHTGTLIADIILHADGVKCVTQTIETMNHVGLVELFESESTVLFGDEQVCQKLNEVLKEIYVKVGECSPEVLVKVKEMLGYICERTPCIQHFPNLQCY